jgi:hypothetical protein
MFFDIALPVLPLSSVNLLYDYLRNTSLGELPPADRVANAHHARAKPAPVDYENFRGPFPLYRCESNAARTCFYNTRSECGNCAGETNRLTESATALSRREPLLSITVLNEL